jgi:hypothetical protein
MPILSQCEAFWRSLQPQLGAMMMLPTEPIGSIPRPAALIAGIQGFEAGRISQAELNALYHAAVQDTIQRLEATGSPVITDGEQAKHSWATYSIYGLENLAPDGVPISFADGHIRIFPRLTAGPFRYKTPADVYLEIAQRYAHVPLKQIEASRIWWRIDHGGGLRTGNRSERQRPHLRSVLYDKVPGDGDGAVDLSVDHRSS